MLTWIHPFIQSSGQSSCCHLQDRINTLTLSGPHRLSSNDLLCSIVWHVSCLVRDRTDSAGSFFLPFDLRQMHVPDAYFGNAHCRLTVLGEFWPAGIHQELFD